MTNEDKYVAVCFRCGSPLNVQDVKATVRGELIEWDERHATEPGEYIKFHLCYGCREAGKAFANGGPRAAVERLKKANASLRVIDIAGGTPGEYLDGDSGNPIGTSGGLHRPNKNGGQI